MAAPAYARQDKMPSCASSVFAKAATQSITTRLGLRIRISSIAEVVTEPFGDNSQRLKSTAMVSYYRNLSSWRFNVFFAGAAASGWRSTKFAMQENRFCQIFEFSVLRFSQVAQIRKFKISSPIDQRSDGFSVLRPQENRCGLAVSLPWVERVGSAVRCAPLSLVAPLSLPVGMSRPTPWLS